MNMLYITRKSTIQNHDYDVAYRNTTNITIVAMFTYSLYCAVFTNIEPQSHLTLRFLYAI